MIHTALIPFLDPESIIAAAGPWALLVVCFIVFAETGLLVGFLLPGDTLLVISGLLSNPEVVPPNGVFGVSVWIVALLIALAAFLVGEVGRGIPGLAVGGVGAAEEGSPGEEQREVADRAGDDHRHRAGDAERVADRRVGRRRRA